MRRCWARRFPADAVTAISGIDSETAATVLGELLRREVLAVSADRLSPERGSYRFSQEMLRQVAYETLSRVTARPDTSRSPRTCAATFANDGEEVIDVVAKHYADALDAVPGDRRHR